MRRLIFALCFCCTTTHGFSQDSASILGNWKVVSVFTGEIYVSTLNDSTYISPELKAQYSENELKGLEKMARIQYLGMLHSFTQKGIYKINVAPGMELESRFELDAAKKIIRQTSPNSLGQDVMEESSYTLIDDTLFLIFKLEDTNLAFTLNRIN